MNICKIQLVYNYSCDCDLHPCLWVNMFAFKESHFHATGIHVSIYSGLGGKYNWCTSLQIIFLLLHILLCLIIIGNSTKSLSTRSLSSGLFWRSWWLSWGLHCHGWRTKVLRHIWRRRFTWTCHSSAIGILYVYHLEYPQPLRNTYFFLQQLYWEIIMCHQHLEFSTAIMKLFKSTWFLPTLCKFRTLAVTVQVNFVVEIDLCATPLYTTE